MPHAYLLLVTAGKCHFKSKASQLNVIWHSANVGAMFTMCALVIGKMGATRKCLPTAGMLARMYPFRLRVTWRMFMTQLSTVLAFVCRAHECSGARTASEVALMWGCVDALMFNKHAFQLKRFLVQFFKLAIRVCANIFAINLSV